MFKIQLVLKKGRSNTAQTTKRTRFKDQKVSPFSGLLLAALSKNWGIPFSRSFFLPNAHPAGRCEIRHESRKTPARPFFLSLPKGTLTALLRRAKQYFSETYKKSLLINASGLIKSLIVFSEQIKLEKTIRSC